MGRVGRSLSRACPRSASPSSLQHATMPAASRLPRSHPPADTEHVSRARAAAAQEQRLITMARLLAHTDVKFRNRGMKRVEAFLSGVSRAQREGKGAKEGKAHAPGEAAAANGADSAAAASSASLPISQYEKVWTTLYYAAWLSDKPLIQRELFVRLALLERVLPTYAEKRKFFKAFFLVMKSNWDRLDCIRVNKFLLLEKIMVAQLMDRMLQSAHKPKKFIAPMARFLAKRVLLDERGGNGLSQQLCQYFLSEFRASRALAQADEEAMIQPVTREQEDEELFFSLFFPFFYAACFTHSAALLHSIHTQIFLELNEDDISPRLLAAALFALGSQSGIVGENRRMLFRTLDAVEAGARATDGGSSFSSLSALASSSPGVARMLAHVETLRASSGAAAVAAEPKMAKKRAESEENGHCAADGDVENLGLSFPAPLSDGEDELAAAEVAQRKGDKAERGKKKREGKDRRESEAEDAARKRRKRECAAPCEEVDIPEEGNGLHLAVEPSKKKAKASRHTQGSDEDSDAGDMDSEFVEGTQFVGKKKKFIGDALLVSGPTHSLKVRAQKLRAGAVGCVGAGGGGVSCLLAAGGESRMLASLGDGDSSGSDDPVSELGTVSGLLRDPLAGKPGGILGAGEAKARAKSRKERGGDTCVFSAPQGGKGEEKLKKGDFEGRDQESRASGSQKRAGGVAVVSSSAEGGSRSDSSAAPSAASADEGAGDRGVRDGPGEPGRSGGEGAGRRREKKNLGSDEEDEAVTRTDSGSSASSWAPTSSWDALTEDAAEAEKEDERRAKKEKKKKKDALTSDASPHSAGSSPLCGKGKSGGKKGVIVPSGAAAASRRRVVFDLKRNRVAAFNRLQPPSAVSPSVSQINLPGVRRAGQSASPSPLSGSAAAALASSGKSSSSASSSDLSSASCPPAQPPTSSPLLAAGSSAQSASGAASSAASSSAAGSKPVLKSILKRPLGAASLPALKDRPHWLSSSSSSPSSRNASAESTPRAAKLKKLSKKKMHATYVQAPGPVLVLPDGDFHSPSPTAAPASAIRVAKKKAKKKSGDVIALPSDVWEAVQGAVTHKREESE